VLKILIADDEPYVREGLLELINWKRHGFKVCAIGLDGNDTLDKIIKHEPHVVLIDIRMPGLTGIEVIRNAREKNMRCQFIILSGYSDFQYAKESILLDVYDYLVKPINEEELMTVISNVHDKVVKEQQMNDKLSQYQQFEHEKELKKLLAGKLDDFLEESTHSLTYQIAFIKEYNDEEKWLNQLTQRIQNLDVLQNSAGIILFFKNVNADFVQEVLSNIARKFQLKIALSKEDLLVKDVAQAYLDVKELMTHLFCFRDANVLTAKMIPTTESEWLETDEIYLAIEFSDAEQKQKAVKKLENYYQARNHSPEHIKGSLINFQSLMFQRFSYNYANLLLPDSKAMAHQIYEQETLQDILQLMAKHWDEIALNIKKSIDSDGDSIKKIKHYVKRYYHKDLSLKIVSQVLNYNATYLGKKFKLETGESFSKYVERVRIDKAKVYLGRDKMKVYEVAEKVGYCNIDYFYRKFKNHVGKSPKEYQIEYLLREATGKEGGRKI